VVKFLDNPRLTVSVTYCTLRDDSVAWV